MNVKPSSLPILLKDERLREYIFEKNVYPREEAALKGIRTATDSQPWIQMAISPDSGQLISMLVKMANAQKTIEIGVFTGYSLLLTTLALPDNGQVIAIDPWREAYEIGLPFMKKAGVEHKINYIQAQALPILDNLLQDESNEGSFDFAFVEADKINYKNYHEKLMKLVKVGGLILYDNTLWAGTVALPEEEVPEPLRDGRRYTIEFNDAIVSDQRVELCLLSTGDGLTVCRRIG